MKKDRPVGQPSIYYKALVNESFECTGPKVDSSPTSLIRQRVREIDRRYEEKARLNSRAMAAFLRKHPELWDMDHGRIKTALVEAKFCSLDTDIVNLDIMGLLRLARTTKKAKS
jgi:hypothetical protein